MKYLLDTNVVSELRKKGRANAGVREWMLSIEGGDLALSVVVLGEIRLGILRLKRRDREAARHLATWFSRLRHAYGDRTLPVDAAVVDTWARLNATRSLSVLDSLQAATALVYGLTLVTRNVADFEGLDVPLLNPFVE